MKPMHLSLPPFARRPVPAATVALGAAALCLAGLALWGPRSATAQTPNTAASSASAAKASLTVTVAMPERVALATNLAANGSVAAWQEAIVGAEVSGLRLTEIQAQVGDVVKRGQVLARYDAQSVQMDVQAARAALAEAQASAAEARANAQRMQSIAESGALSAQQLSQAAAADASAAARVESAKAQLASAELRLRHTQVLAPDDGVVTARQATLGAVAGPGAELFRMIRQGRLEWRGEFTAAELHRLKAGQTVALWGPNGARCEGRIRQVAPSVDPATRNALVYADLAPAEAQKAGLRAGMFARGEVALGDVQALTVPQSAVLLRDGFAYVMALGPNNKVQRLKVEVGRVAKVNGVARTEVLAGLNGTQAVVSSGAPFLADGDTVKVVKP